MRRRAFRGDVPLAFQRLYEQAGYVYGLDWRVLASLGRTESDHGRSRLVGVRSGTNASGAAGPMQFMAATWHRYGVDADADGKADIYEPADAIFAAARYLRDVGAPEQWHSALARYGHSTTFADRVLAEAWAEA